MYGRLIVCMVLAVSSAWGISPFSVSLTPLPSTQEGNLIRVDMAIPAEHLIYAESFKVSGDPAPVCVTSAPSVEHQDFFEPEKRVKVYTQSFTTEWKLDALHDGLSLSVDFQGCNQKVCFMPETRLFRYKKAANRFVEGEEEGSGPVSGTDWKHGRAVTTAGGYLSASELLAFLDRAEGKPVAETSTFALFLDDPVAFLKRYGLWLTLLLVLMGGVLLNLTPCVLPMIPINLAIIGAGHGRRGRGFLLGLAYGFGMMIAYGGSGWVILKSGIFIGTLQSSPWFSLAVSLLFGALALSLFGLFAIDLTRFSGRLGIHQQGLFAAFLMGAISAILAGACVAPVVLAVLLLAGTLTTEGVAGAQLLPFVLGLGMALPWPFAGAGLSVLPRPGAWMVRVERVFGAILLCMSLYYGYLAFVGFLPAAVSERKGSIVAGDAEVWRKALAQAEQEGKPVFVDFWASWCKNCTVMEKTTFKDPQVVERLKNYKVILVQTEQPKQPEAKEMLQAFGIRGLPGFAVLSKTPVNQ